MHYTIVQQWRHERSDWANEWVKLDTSLKVGIDIDVHSIHPPCHYNQRYQHAWTAMLGMNMSVELIARRVVQTTSHSAYDQDQCIHWRQCTFKRMIRVDASNVISTCNRLMMQLHTQRCRCSSQRTKNDETHLPLYGDVRTQMYIVLTRVVVRAVFS